MNTYENLLNNDFNQLLSEESANEGLSKEDLAKLERGKGIDANRQIKRTTPTEDYK